MEYGTRDLITAGAGGNGREIALAFVEKGAKVFVCEINQDGLEKLKQEIPGIETRICNVSKREDIEQMVAVGVEALGGGLDVLVNNAGIAGPTVPIDEFDPDAWEQVV